MEEQSEVRDRLNSEYSTLLESLTGLQEVKFDNLH
jgi:hypothetical protein